MSARRFQHRVDVARGLRVVGWGAHLYGFKIEQTPPVVAVQVFQPDSTDAPLITFSLDISPAEARRFAAALVEAADKAEAEPPTYDDVQAVE